jgi:hypothetical protein
VTDDSAQPVLRVVHGGELSAEELVALTVAVVARGAATEEVRDAPTSRWADRRGRLRQPLHPGPGRWVASARH